MVKGSGRKYRRRQNVRFARFDVRSISMIDSGARHKVYTSMRESVRLDHDRWHACANSIFFSSLRIPGGMCGERADEVGEVLKRRVLYSNSSHNTPIATPSPLSAADELCSHGRNADRLVAPTNRRTDRDVRSGFQWRDSKLACYIGVSEKKNLKKGGWVGETKIHRAQARSRRVDLLFHGKENDMAATPSKDGIVP